MRFLTPKSGQAPQSQIQTAKSLGKLQSWNRRSTQGYDVKHHFSLYTHRPSEPCVWESATCSAARLRSRAVWHTRAPALALSWYSHTNWTQSSVCFWGNVFLSHLTSDLKSIRFPPPFLLEVHESQSRQTNESPGQFLVKRASLGGSSVIKCERGWLCW